ncbi:hypothetical protein DPSP01_006554 [Paraphaeosphaeria sporulosa]|uniref:Catalase n=1 Tax=Paraphaeosphaeria sporulosa TaxID=1460663 RepID=A0A177CMN4_9PLEO|nr:catalase [Paraphaeosphaeria sporulosa]OAG08556.1 catalase [Paraphaeosphaeria sporulosa]
MDDEWQTTALGSRHMHNRVQNKSSRKYRPFDVHKTFGSYSCKWAAGKRRDDNHDDENDITLELYRLSPHGEGVLGEIRFPRALDAAVVLSGSRASLDKTVRGIEVDSDEEDDEETQSEEKNESGSDERDAEDPVDDREFEEEPARFRKFEKNSFREPKFWIRWNGMTEGAEVVTSDLGYVVFSGNECRNFKGTITCEALGWKDAAISGRKVSGRAPSDVPINWNGKTL